MEKTDYTGQLKPRASNEIINARNTETLEKPIHCILVKFGIHITSANCYEKGKKENKRALRIKNTMARKKNLSEKLNRCYFKYN